MNLASACFSSPIGWLRVTTQAGCIIRLELLKSEDKTNSSATPLLEKAILQLKDYFAGQRQTFDLPIAPNGTRFQQDVWTCLQSVGYGTTASYKHIAEKIGRPKAYRAVGTANGNNPLPIIIPCHRIITSSGALGGYAYGLEIKQFLLRLESQYKNRL